MGVRDDVGQVSKLDQLLHVRGGVVSQEVADCLPPHRDRHLQRVAPPGEGVIVHTPQKVLEKVLTQDYVVPTIGLLR